MIAYKVTEFKELKEIIHDYLFIYGSRLNLDNPCLQSVLRRDKESVLYKDYFMHDKYIYVVVSDIDKDNHIHMDWWPNEAIPELNFGTRTIVKYRKFIDFEIIEL